MKSGKKNPPAARRRRAVVALPVRASPPRRSRTTRWRAASLIAVHLLMALHIAHSCDGTRTLGPLEPAESMEFSKRGVVNAGLIFFGLAIASTLLLGRWFCGWACHVVALQDFSRWVLEKLHVRPAPLRSRVLRIMPLVALIYMFIVPLLERALRGLTGNGDPGDWISGVHLTTDNFWASFPGWLGASLTFLTCGFFAVYFLGAKGFCTNGCPYGAVFGVAERFAPLRIRVTDACDARGHCTAVCTSNVRVHEEVRRFGQVVDPGCMKCLDCVSVCPNDALFVGLRGDERARGPATAAAEPQSSAKRSAVPRSISLVRDAFALAAMALFVSFGLLFRLSLHDALVIFAGAALAIATARLMSRGPSAAHRHEPLRDEVLLGVFFLALVALFRGTGGLVAFLLSLGVAGVGALLLLGAARLLLDRNVTLRGRRLKRAGRWQPVGYAYAASIALALAACVPLARGQIRGVHGTRARITIAAFEAAGAPAHLARDAELAYRLVIEQNPAQAESYLGLGMLLAREQRLDEAQAVYETALGLTDARGRVLTNIALLHAVRGESAQAEQKLREAISADATLVEPRTALGELLLTLGRVEEARSTFAAAIALRPDHTPALFGAAYAAMAANDLPAARAHLDAVLARQPNHAEARRLAKELASAP